MSPTLVHSTCTEGLSFIKKKKENWTFIITVTYVYIQCVSFITALGTTAVMGCLSGCRFSM